MNKTCTHCRNLKPLTEFYRHKNGKPQACCKLCNNQKSSNWAKANRAKANALTHDWLKRNPDYHRKRLIRRHGMTPAAFAAMFEKQNGKCAICQDPFETRKKTHIDHCHSTMKIRGLLCSNCNLGIGNLKHNPQILTAALQYLISS